jgi:hypothetical protein
VTGSPGIGKSVFGVYFLARLIASRRSTFLGHSFVLFQWGERRRRSSHFRIRLNGEAKWISVEEFQSYADAGAFAIVDDLARNKTSEIGPYLSIASPTECVDFPAVSFRQYVPPITELQLGLLAGVSRMYPLRNADAEDPTALSTHGSIESRMKIAGGHLRWLLSLSSLAELKSYFGTAARKIGATPTPDDYFHERGYQRPYHGAFAFFPEEPFTEPGRIGYVSDFVERTVMEASRRPQ